MFKSGFALVLIAFACNCYTSPLDEGPEREMDESLTELSDDFEHAFDETDDGGYDEREDEYFEDENAYDPIEGNSSSSTNNSMRTISEDPRWRARCGGRKYYTRKYICCAGFVRRKPRFGRPACCGNQAYNARWKMCCGSTIRFRTLGRPRCCRNRAYNANWKMCCGGVVRIKPIFGTRACCGTRTFDYRWFKCCGWGKVKTFC